MKKLILSLILLSNLALAQSNLTPQSCWLSDGSGNPISSVAGALSITGGGGGAAFSLLDKYAYTYGTDSFVPGGGVFLDTSPDLTAGQAGIQRLTAKRAAHVNLRDASGNEISPATAANQSTANSSLSSIDGKIPASPATSGNQTSANTKLDSLITNTTGASTAAKQDTGNSSLSSIDGKIPASPATAGNQTTANSSLSSIDGKLAASGSNGIKVDPLALEQAATPAMTQISSSASSVSVLSSNANRRHFVLVNDSTQVCYVAFGATASASAYTLRMWPNSVYTANLPVYTGAVSAIWASANGGLKVTEITQ